MHRQGSLPSALLFHFIVVCAKKKVGHVAFYAKQHIAMHYTIVQHNMVH